MNVPDELRDAIKQRYKAEEVRVMPNERDGAEEVYAYGMMPDSTIYGWFPLGDLDELEKELRASGEL